MSKSNVVSINAGSESQSEAQQQASNRKFSFRRSLLVLIARMGVKSSYLVLAEVRDAKACFGKVQFIFRCRPWLLDIHLSAMQKLAIDQAVAMGMFKAGDAREVNILMATRLGLSE